MSDIFDPLIQILELVVAIIGLLTGLIVLIYKSITWLKIHIRSLKSGKREEKASFHLYFTLFLIFFLFFLAFISAGIGGFLWNFLNHLNEQFKFMGESVYVGGNVEPHGIAIIIWTVATTLPMSIMIFVLSSILNRIPNYPFITISVMQQLILHVIFTFGITIGAAIFYDVQIYGNLGFRNFLNTPSVSSIHRELLLAAIWPWLISIFGFGLLALSKRVFLLKWHTTTTITSSIWQVFIWQTGTCVIATWLTIVLFLFAFPNSSQFDTARGIVAGLALRIPLFIGLFIGFDVKLDGVLWLLKVLRKTLIQVPTPDQSDIKL